MDRVGTVLNIDGNSSVTMSASLRTAVHRLCPAADPFPCFLRDVSAIDAAGLGLLHRLAGLGVQLMALASICPISSRTCSAAGQPGIHWLCAGGDHA